MVLEVMLKDSKMAREGRKCTHIRRLHHCLRLHRSKCFR